MSEPAIDDMQLFTVVLTFYLIAIGSIIMSVAIYSGIDHPYYFYLVPIAVLVICASLLIWASKRTDSAHRANALSWLQGVPVGLLCFPTFVGFYIVANTDNLPVAEIRAANLGIFNFIESYLDYSWEDISVLGRADSLQLYFTVIVSIYHFIWITIVSIIFFPMTYKLGIPMKQNENLNWRIVFLLIAVVCATAFTTINIINDWNFYYRFGIPYYNYWIKSKAKGVAFTLGFLPMLAHYTLHIICAFYTQLRGNQHTHIPD